MGKAYYYKAATRPRSAFRTMLGELVDTYCGGSVQNLVMNIIKSEKLSEQELLELKRLAEGNEPDSPAQQEEPEMSATSIGSDLLSSLAGIGTVAVLVARWTLLLALAWLAHAALGGRNPRWRVALWRGAIVGVGLVVAMAMCRRS